MSEEMQPIDPITAAVLIGETPEPCEPIIEISRKVLTRLLDAVEFGDQLERVEKDRLLGHLKDMLAEEQPKLWVIHCVGPNELYPMISKEAAEQHAAELAEMFSLAAEKYGCRFDVIPSPFSPLEHFELLAEETIEQRDDLLEYVKELKQSAEATDATLDKLRAAGLSIDGDNAYKRDLLDAAVGSMLCGRQNTNPPPAGHWAQRFWDIGREYGEVSDAAPAIVLPMPVMPEQPEDAIDDSWMDGYNAALRMREECMRAIEAAGLAAPAVVNEQLTTAASDVLAERQRQVTAEGWTPEHDDQHDAGELAVAAGCYAIWSGDTLGVLGRFSWKSFFPWDWKWWKPSGSRRNLVKAGALILAEIERLDRGSAPGTELPAPITMKTCTWKHDEETSTYDTGCGQKWHFTDGGEPEEHGALFCHHCGSQIVVERRQLFAYQVGDNDIVAAYDPAGAIQVLCEFNGCGDDFDKDDVDLVSDKVLDNTEAYDQDEGKTITLEKTLRQELAELTEPAYLCGWE